ncbi:MAG: hypothetical protein JSU00_13730 [Acidobacteria bacterium]|nr:hypothetical protein [Acidobacteriota bacterium]
MPVVFDEVQGEVEPEAPRGEPNVEAEPHAQQRPPQLPLKELRAELRRMSARCARLFAD